MWALTSGNPPRPGHAHRPCTKLMAADLPGEKKIVNLPRNAIPEDDRERQPRASPKPPPARADAADTKAFKTSQVDHCALRSGPSEPPCMRGATNRLRTVT
ncbi:hypothetical protein N7449_000953 [Penicillium cf. viridicatum]|uniref:Uncharacterized protein n=1 Tax=Penicillium cf. viridicatum TaxID=2972119 RepID=A0A9W9T911_9EURO|nr:hypothetical protein N7449_000953 [Penicillium cf. viridicatum]